MVVWWLWYPWIWFISLPVLRPSLCTVQVNKICKGKKCITINLDSLPGFQSHITAKTTSLASQTYFCKNRVGSDDLRIQPVSRSTVHRYCRRCKTTLTILLREPAYSTTGNSRVHYLKPAYVIQLIAFQWDKACIHSSPDPSFFLWKWVRLMRLKNYLAKMTTAAGYCSFRVHWTGESVDQIKETQLSSINPLTIYLASQTFVS